MSLLATKGRLCPQSGASHRLAEQATTARFILAGKPLPRVEDSLRIGELVRSAVMSRSRKVLGEDQIPPNFSGHDMPAGNRHRHAFYLPSDSNSDGRIDRIVLHVPDGMDKNQQRVLAGLERLWSGNGAKWRLVLEEIGDERVGGALTHSCAIWTSVTPYLHPWHVKKRFTLEDQIRRECRERGLPEPIHLERLNEIRVGSRLCGPIRFQRFRARRRNPPDRHGSFWRLTFPEPISGPLALGFGAHFGLGLFIAQTRDP
ncbi:type I-U CRISPR-associated protein Csb2 [Acidihalobacter ferrooxydans]|uniref:Type I-U CRISPR-associated protein Cas5/Cas6 n=1 Tax=Acidihalobacter ferrooxydans TaxID=1765967 RepID=A0A1P8UKD5_9GAMM|nr:type I-U CRISPR-associated protein Csb2 [Acidihalobacter ferrooxydans]APZ44301.1 type I-U CRISPR-associated protein Cas5/Cas6 [Acidihalobacter ferrooxydans]